MKLLTTAIFLIVSLVMMNSSFAHDNDEFIVAFKEQTEAIKEQTEVMKEQIESFEEQTLMQIESFEEQTLIMKALTLYTAESYNLGYDDEDLIDIDEDLNKVIAYLKKIERRKAAEFEAKKNLLN